ncbi:MAG: leucyl aminopeptidase, partial [Dehalococcoidia bacterium]|nr:leucyl aminopeptidase [Dehalococcoidia bacterium]
MEIKTIVGGIAQIEADAIVVNLFEGMEQPGGATAAVDEVLDGAISSLISRGEIKGKFGEVSIVHTFGKLPAGIVAIAGLGKRQDFNVDRIRGITGDFSRALRKLNCHKIATILHGTGIGGIELEAAAEAIAEGALLGLYGFTKYKKPEYEDIEEILLAVREKGKVPILETAIGKGKLVAEATNLARDMVNEPANYMTPTDMAETATRLAETYGLEVSVLEREQMQELGMGALLGVAQGSRQPPKFIVLRYKGGDSAETDVALVGKGITFDSGGISIKRPEKMDEMKGDMAG